MRVLFTSEKVMRIAQNAWIFKAADRVERDARPWTNLVSTLKQEESHFWLFEIHTWHSKLQQDIPPLNITTK